MNKNPALTLILIVTSLILGASVDLNAAPPEVRFESPTPDDSATVTEATVQVNAVVTEADLAELTFNWAGTDYALYDDSLVLMFNFDNVSEFGEDYTSQPELGVRDLSPYGNDAILGIVGSNPLTGVPAWLESGGFYGAFEFFGAESILVPHNPDGSLDPGAGDFAVALWVLTPENVDSDIMRKGSTNTVAGYNMWYKIEHSAASDNKISLNFNTDATDATVYSANSYADYNWHFVVAQRRGAQAELWVDGVLEGTAAISGNIYNEANLTLGSKDTQNDDFFIGMIDEVRIYKRSFAADQVQLLYDSMLSKYKYPAGATEWTLEVTRSGLDSGDYAYAVSATNGAAETTTEARTVTVALPVPPDVTLVSPAPGSVLNTTTVTFIVDAADPVGLSDATLYVGTAGQTVTFSGPAETEDAQLYASDDTSTGTVEGPDTNAGDAVNLNIDGANPHSHVVIKFPNLIGAGPGQVPMNSPIDSATLQVNCTNPGAMMQVYRLTSDWSEASVTWNSPWAAPGGDYDGAVVVNGDCTATGVRTIDITQFVQAWSDGAPNYGILLTDTGTDGVDIDSSEGTVAPLLTVTCAGSWVPVQTVSLSGTSDTAVFTDVLLDDMTDYIWNCLVSNTANPPMASWAPANFSLTVDSQSPDEPVLVSPSDGATGVAVPVLLEVTVSDPQADVLDVTFYGRKGVSGAEEFTIVVLPDTQNYCEFPENSHIFTAQTQWIADNIATRNIVFVSHEGDVVENPDSTVEYDRARTSLSIIDPGLADLGDPGLPDPLVPYGISPGNHDLPTGPPPSGYFNTYLPYTHYENRGLPWYGGHYPSEGNDNSYQLFSAGGTDFVVVHLAYNPGSTIDDPVIAWADGVLKAYPDRVGIITTHAYLDTDGTRLAEGIGIWNVLVQNNDNVYLVLCGHRHGEAMRTDTVNGRQVHQILADYQSRANGGDGWLRIMRFVPAESKIYVETYSPYLDLYETDSDSQFTLDMPLNWFTEIGTNTGVPNGSTTSVEWAGLEDGSDYQWYVTVTDPTARTSVGPVWSFTTAAPPGPATNPSPADGATDVDISETYLTWTADGGATAHDVYFGTDAGALSLVSQEQTEASYDPGTLAYDTTYYWRIDEVGPGGTRTGSVWSFTTIVAAPAQATNPEPGDGASGQNIDVDLSWTADPTATAHDVYFGTDAASLPPVSLDQAGTTYDPGTLAANTTYYWRIDEKNAGGLTTGAVWSFTTAPAPGAASSPIPADGLSDLDPASIVLSWTAGSDATSHDVYLGTDQASPPLVSDDQAGTSYDPGGLDNTTTYYWRIDEVGPGGTTTGTVWSFTTSVAPPGQATNPNPPSPSTDVSFDVVLSWTAGTGADSHDVYFGTDPDPRTNPPINQTQTTYVPSNLQPTTTYYWAIDEVGQGGTTAGAVWMFTTKVNDAPTADAGPDQTVGDPDGSGDQAVTLSGSGSDTDGTIVSYEWKDGANVLGTTPVITPTLSVGVHTITLTVTDNGGATGADTVVVTVNANVPPSANAGADQTVTDSDNSGSEVVTLSGSGSDVDGTIDTYVWKEGAVTIGTGATITPDLPVGTHTITLIVTDNGGTTGSDDVVVTVEQAPTAIYDTADADIPVSGSLAGSFTLTAVSDNQRQAITEIVQGKRKNARSVLEHKWTINVTGGDQVSFHLEAHRTDSGEGDSFVFAYSTDDSTYTDLLVVTKTTDDDTVQTAVMPSSLSGTVYIRVQDADRSKGATDLDTVYVDHMYIRSVPSGGPDLTPPSAPTGLSASPGNSQVSLDWNDNTEGDLAGYNVYRSTTAGGGYVKLNGALVTTSDYLDTAVINGITYYYVVTAVDEAQNESSYSGEVSATPVSQPQTVHVENITMALNSLPRGKWNATATVLVHDQAAVPVSGATVVGNWYYKGILVETGATAVTGATGEASLTSPDKNAKSGQVFKFVVTDIIATGYTYDDTQNVVTEGSIAVP